MPKKTVVQETTPVRTVRPKAAKAVPSVEVASTPRVKSVKHSRISTPVVAINAHDQIAKIAYGYWEARSFQPGSPEQDWLRAEREYLLQA